MVGKKNGKGKPGVLSKGKGVSKEEDEADGEGLDPEQGGSGKLYKPPVWYLHS
jgi:hypothetical protein